MRKINVEIAFLFKYDKFLNIKIIDYSNAHYALGPSAGIRQRRCEKVAAELKIQAQKFDNLRSYQKSSFCVYGFIWLTIYM